MKKCALSPFFAPIVTTVLWALFIWIIYIFYADTFPNAYLTTRSTVTPAVADDNGLIEIITNILYGVMFAVFAYYAKDFVKSDKAIDFTVFVLLGVSAFLREVGIQHWLAGSDSTAFKSRFFLNPNNQISEKVEAGIILIAFFLLFLYVLVKYSKHLVISFFKLNATTWSVATLCTVALASKMVDRFPSHYRKAVGERMDISLRNFLYIVEETGEALLPLITIFILWQYFKVKNEKIS